MRISANHPLRRLFHVLTERNLELCVFGLGYVRSDLDRLRRPEFQQVINALGE